VRALMRLEWRRDRLLFWKRDAAFLLDWTRRGCSLIVRGAETPQRPAGALVIEDLVAGRQRGSTLRQRIPRHGAHLKKKKGGAISITWIPSREITSHRKFRTWSGSLSISIERCSEQNKTKKKAENTTANGDIAEISSAGRGRRAKHSNNEMPQFNRARNSSTVKQLAKPWDITIYGS